MWWLSAPRRHSRVSSVSAPLKGEWEKRWALWKETVTKLVVLEGEIVELATIFWTQPVYGAAQWTRIRLAFGPIDSSLTSVQLNVAYGGLCAISKSRLASSSAERRRPARG